MTQNSREKSRQKRYGFRSLRAWLLSACVALLLLLMSGPLIAPYFFDAAAVKRSIRAAVEERISGRFDYHTMDILFLPRPALELHGVELEIPGRVTASVDTLMVAPKLFSLLTGQLHLAAIEVDRPHITVDLPVPAGVDGGRGGVGPEDAILGPIVLLTQLRGVMPTLKLTISNGRFSLRRGGDEQLDLSGLTIRSGLLVVDPASAQATLEGSLASLTLRRQEQSRTIRNLAIHGSIRTGPEELSLQLDHLAVKEPALTLQGKLFLAREGETSSIELHGQDIDVDNVRRLATHLAADRPVVNNIFRYLRGGRVTQLSVLSHAKTPGELGSLANLSIEGRLQGGAVTIPDIALDLVDVDSEVQVNDGILVGRDISARLEGTSGHDGLLKVGLGAGRDLFQLRLTLNADLAQAHQVLQRIIQNPAFKELLGKISDLQGRGTAVLTLGDSLDRIRAELATSDLRLTAHYQGVPLLIAIDQGKVNFTGEQVDIRGLEGRLGNSLLTGINGSIGWQQGLSLDLSCAQGALDLDELYPWLAQQESLQKPLEQLGRLSGKVALQDAHVTGGIDLPEPWLVAANGELHSVSLASPTLPDVLELARGTFHLGEKKVVFEGLEGRLLDAVLSASGSLEVGVPQAVDGLDITLDGVVGRRAIAWLMDAFTAPVVFAPRDPLRLSGTRISWQNNGITAASGRVNVAGGPDLTFDLANEPGQLRINQLTIKDNYSDARISYGQTDGDRNLVFKGALHHQSLAELFVDPVAGQGEAVGDFAISVPNDRSAPVVTQGNLHGKNLVWPLQDGTLLSADRLDLAGENNRVRMAGTTVTWGDRTWQSLQAEVDFRADRIDARLDEARLCGVNTPGRVTLAGPEFDLELTLEGEGLEVASSYSCLTKGRIKMTGVLDLAGRISARGEPDKLLGTLQGPLKMTFRKGVIKQEKTLARLLEVLNITEIVKGRLPNLDTKGFAYTTISVRGEFKGGRLILEELAMDGETLDVLGRGQIDLVRQTIDVELLAAPFKTADTIIRNLPGINYLLAGTLVNIPVSVKGDLSDPKIQVLSPSAVGSSLLGLAERTLKAPIKLIETLTPGPASQDTKKQ